MSLSSSGVLLHLLLGLQAHALTSSSACFSIQMISQPAALTSKGAYTQQPAAACHSSHGTELCGPAESLEREGNIQEELHTSRVRPACLRWLISCAAQPPCSRPI